MKFLTIIAFIMLFGFSIGAGCAESEYDKIKRKELKAERLQSYVNRIIMDIEYIRDPRTESCFAYYWGGLANHGPSLATVPCKNIPSKLLNTARLKFGDKNKYEIE